MEFRAAQDRFVDLKYVARTGQRHAHVELFTDVVILYPDLIERKIILREMYYRVHDRGHLKVCAPNRDLHRER
jgi:hypothetical protein